jgi:hypothetical protein
MSWLQMSWLNTSQAVRNSRVSYFPARKADLPVAFYRITGHTQLQGKQPRYVTRQTWFIAFERCVACIDLESRICSEQT